MSQTTTFQIDPYLAQQKMPQQELVIDPQFHNIRMVTPVGRLAYVHVAKPHAIPSSDPGKPARPKYSATLLMAPGTNENPIVADLWKAACMVADAHWPALNRPDPANPSNIISVKGSAMFGVDPRAGGLHFPLRQGDHSYASDPVKFAAWRGLYFINTGMNPTTKNGAEQRPVTFNVDGTLCDPNIFYSGCYGRLAITVAPFDNSGNKGVTFYLNSVQFARHGERMGGFDAGASAGAMFAKAGALSGDVGAAPVGFGPNTAGPGSMPPGGAPFGFAAPPAPIPAQQAAAPPAATPTPQQGFVPFNPPSQQPSAAPAASGFRPPGV